MHDQIQGFEYLGAMRNLDVKNLKSFLQEETSVAFCRNMWFDVSFNEAILCAIDELVEIVILPIENNQEVRN